MKAVHQFDAKGNHRLGISKIVPGDGTKHQPFKFGEWASYTSPAIFRNRKGYLVAVSDYYAGSKEFPNPDKLYVVSEHPGYDLKIETII